MYISDLRNCDIKNSDKIDNSIRMAVQNPLNVVLFPKTTKFKRSLNSPFVLKSKYFVQTFENVQDSEFFKKGSSKGIAVHVKANIHVV